eukprot:5383_1
MSESTNSTKKKFKHSKRNILRFSKRHVALRLAYVGTDFHGFASQADNSNTIEEHLMNALRRSFLIQEEHQEINYSRCGRTDIGVSAMGNVVSLYVRSNLGEGVGVVPSTHPDKKPTKATEIDYPACINACLPAEIRILAWAPVDSQFSARFSCRGRVYKYYFFADNMDIPRMREAALMLCGVNDYRNFCKIDVINVANFVRRIDSVTVEPCCTSENGTQSLSSGDRMYEITISGTAYLWHQVRYMVQVLFLVGRGLEEPDIVHKLLDINNCPGKPLFPMASQLPLVLYDCRFPNLNFEVSEASKVRIYHVLHAKWRQKILEAKLLEGFCSHLVSDNGLPLEEGQRYHGHQLTRHQLKHAPHTKLLKRNCDPSLEKRLETMSGRKRKLFDKKQEAREYYNKKSKIEGG